MSPRESRSAGPREKASVAPTQMAVVAPSTTSVPGGEGEEADGEPGLERGDDGVERQLSGEHAEGTANCCEQKALKAELADELGATATEGEAYGELALPGLAAREEKAGEVEADDEQDGASKRHQDGTERGDDTLCARRGTCAEAGERSGR
jgi:hypothetical protein